MTKPEQNLLFQKAHDRLKLALYTADAMKGGDAEGMAQRLASLTGEANAATNAYYNAVKGTPTPDPVRG